MNSLNKRTISGISWSMFDSVSRLVLTFIIGAVLARLLKPSDFGTIAMIFVFTGFLKILRDFGVGASIIQKSKLTDLELDSLFWLTTLIGLAVACLLMLFSSAIASFYSLPELNLLIKVISIAIFLGSISIIPESLIKKELNFRALFFRNTGNILLSGSFTIWLAYLNYGVWALIFKEIAFNALLIVFSFSLTSWRPSFRFDVEVIKPYIKFSLPLFGENTLNFFVRNIDNLLIGRILGNAILGFYSKGYSLMLLPVRQISGSIANVMFPALSIIKNEKQRVWENYLRVVKVVLFVNFPLIITLYFFATEIVLMLFGNQWLEVVPIVKALCFLGAIQSIGTLSGSVYNSQGETKLQFKVGLFSKTIMSTSIILGLLNGGILRMILFYSISSSAILIVELYFVSKVLDHTVFDFFIGLKKEIFLVVIFLSVMTSLFCLVDEQEVLHKVYVLITSIVTYITLSNVLETSAIKWAKNYFQLK